MASRRSLILIPVLILCVCLCVCVQVCEKMVTVEFASIKMGQILQVHKLEDVILLLGSIHAFSKLHSFNQLNYLSCSILMQKKYKRRDPPV